MPDMNIGDVFWKLHLLGISNVLVLLMREFLEAFASAFCSRQLLLAVSSLGSTYCLQLIVDNGILNTNVTQLWSS